MTSPSLLTVPRWPVQEAKSKFSEFLTKCISEGPQVVTKRGLEAAVLIPIEQWRRLLASANPSLKELLLVNKPRGELLIPKRGSARRRSVVEVP